MLDKGLLLCYTKSMKTCPACHIAKPLEDFNRQASNKDGRYPYCRDCAQEKVRALYRLRGKQSWVNDKTCSWCKVLKSRTEFRKDDRGKPAARCLACEAEVAAHDAAGERRCNICREYLPYSAFYASKLKFPNIACQACTREQVAQPGYKLRRRNFVLLREYGITLDQYKELLERQDNKCPICKVTFEPGNFSYHVDHIHNGKWAGRIRAILHQDCNRFVMWMHDDSAQLRAAADLIDNPLTDWIVPKPTLNERRREKERKK